MLVYFFSVSAQKCENASELEKASFGFLQINKGANERYGVTSWRLEGPGTKSVSRSVSTVAFSELAQIFLCFFVCLFVFLLEMVHEM